jgi:threonine dehydratase
MLGTPEFVAEHGREIELAQRRIAGRIRRTPTLRTDIDERLVLKAENLQLTGAFKVRGAFNAILRLRERQPRVDAVCTVSSGNHARAVAYAAKACGLHAVVIIPAGANPIKVAATRALGAEVVSDGVTFDNREEFAARVAGERGLVMVHPFDDWDVIHGQGTVALEVLDDCDDVEAIVAPVGGGGLLSGIALAARHRRAGVEVIGVEPESAADAAASLASGTRQRLPRTPTTLADGVKVLAIGERNFDVLVQRRLVDAIVTVSEREIGAAVEEIWRLGRLFVEPTAALPLAAYRAGKLPISNSGRVVLVLSGGNFDPAVVCEIFQRRETATFE